MSSSEQKFKIRPAVSGDAEEIYALMNTTYAQMPDKSMFVCDDLTFVKSHIADEGFILKTQNERDEIVAALIIRFPNENEDNLGNDLNFNKFEIPRIAHAESVVVDVKWRGRGIFARMLAEAEQIVKQKNYKYILATVAPDNIASKNTFLKCGYEVCATLEKYDGLVRNIVKKEL